MFKFKLISFGLFFNFILVNAQSKNENSFMTTAMSMVAGTWPDKTEVNKIAVLESNAAIKYIAKKAGIITQSQSNALNDGKIIATNDAKVTNFLTIPAGNIIGFFNNGRLVHSMISLDRGEAIGTDNLKTLGIGVNDKLEKIKLTQLLFDKTGVISTKAGLKLTVSCKSVDNILNTNSGNHNSGSFVKPELNTKPNLNKVKPLDTFSKQKPTNLQNGDKNDNLSLSQRQKEYDEVLNANFPGSEDGKYTHNIWKLAFDYTWYNKYLKTDEMQLKYDYRLKPADVLTINKLDAAAAIKFLAVKTEVLTQIQANAIKNEQIISINDQPVYDLSLVEKCNILGFIKNGKIVHYMLKGGTNETFGVQNLKNLGLSANSVWERIDLERLIKSNEKGEFTINNVKYTIVTKPIKDIAIFKNWNEPVAKKTKVTYLTNEELNKLSNKQKPNEYDSPESAFKGFEEQDSINKANAALNKNTKNTNKKSANYDLITDSMLLSEDEIDNNKNTITKGYGKVNSNNNRKVKGKSGEYEPVTDSIFRDENNEADNVAKNGYTKPSSKLASANSGYTKPAADLKNNIKKDKYFIDSVPIIKPSGISKPAVNRNNAIKQHDSLNTISSNNIKLPGVGNNEADIDFNPLTNLNNLGKYKIIDWAPNGTITPVANANEQFNKFKLTNKSLKNIVQYVTIANNFYLKNAGAEKVKVNNGLIIYDHTFNLLAHYTNDGKPMVMYCPARGEEEFTEYVNNNK